MGTKLLTAEREKVHGQFAPPRAAYIHVPFCRHRCGYCNFALVTGRDDLIGDYLRAIELELARLKIPREVETLYFGGGTPTYLSESQIQQLAATVLHWHPLAQGYEWTVEANPADVDESMIETLAALGVTRLSLGGQSFRPEKLRLLERDHEAAHIGRAVKFASRAGMQISLDLIFATPGETLDDWSADLDAALALAPNHISTYGLTFEQGTAYWNRRLRGELEQVDEALERDMYALAIDRLTAAGFEHYEVSNFAKPGCRSRHNETYWSGAGYYATGPGAARYVDGIRESNHRSTTTYLKHVLAGRSPVAESEHLSPEARARELLVFGLRRLKGVTRNEFAEITCYEVDELVGGSLRKFVELGMLVDDGYQIRLTRDGLFVSDAMWPELL
ncbi:MAG: radical SAM family heme chaperone HemW [Planctomycetes bacterium]|nr:radical SAM family heme chaperone HemW [Planctomycetota bacterium]